LEELLIESLFGRLFFFSSDWFGGAETSKASFLVSLAPSSFLEERENISQYNIDYFLEEQEDIFISHKQVPNLWLQMSLYKTNNVQHRISTLTQTCPKLGYG